MRFMREFFIIAIFKIKADIRMSQNPRLSRGLEEALEGLHAGTHLKMHRKIFHLHHSHCCPQVGNVAFTARHSENNF